MRKLLKHIRKFYHKSIHSIGFIPGLISILILAIFIFIYWNEDSQVADSIKSHFLWLNLQHTEAARTIVSTIATGVLGLTVFSFSMVMVVMSQAAAQMSNRILDNLIGNKFQQVTLGFYLGTILASFFLLSVVDDKGSPAVPSLSVFLLVLITIIDLFFFVSFLHYITQSVRFEKLIRDIHQKTIKTIERAAKGSPSTEWNLIHPGYAELPAPYTNYFQGIHTTQLVRFAEKHNLQVEILPFRCTHVIKGEVIARVYYYSKPDQGILDSLCENFDFYTGQEIDKNAFYGYLHLTEVAIKALSPGINDPNTAVLCIDALTDLLIIKMQEEKSEVFEDQDGVARVLLRERSFENLFELCLYPVLDYGKDDRFVRRALNKLVDQLKRADSQEQHNEVIDLFAEKLQQ